MNNRAHANRPIRSGVLARLMRIVFLLFLIGIGIAILANRESLWNSVSGVLADVEEDPIPLQVLARGPFELKVEAEGEIVGLKSVPVTTPRTRSGGLKVSWLILEGSLVERGQSVVRFDSTDAALELEKQQNTLDANQERYRIAVGDQATDKTILGIDLTDARKEYEYAMTVMPQDETIFSKWEIIEAQINAHLAEERIDFLKNKGRVQRRIARSDKQILAIEKNKAVSEQAIAQQTLDSLELSAPRDGLVIYNRRSYRMREPQIGDESYPGDTLIEIVDLNALQARIYVLERDAGSLKRGKGVRIRLDSIPERDFHGTISSVSTLAQPLDRKSPLKYFVCEVLVDDGYEDILRIKPGMSLEAEVVLELYDDCFVVPASAIEFKDTEILVYIRQGERFVPRAVKIGAGSHGQTTVLEGVKVGEILAMRNPFETRKAHLPDFSKAGAKHSSQMRMRGGMGYKRMVIRH